MACKLSRVLMAAVFALGVAAAQAPASLTVPTTGSTVIGGLALDGVAQGALVAGVDGVAFHTFWFDVPAGVGRWTLRLEADADLDLAVKFGSSGIQERDQKAEPDH